MTNKPRLLDLFCGAGGTARGYQRAGFYVVGIDNRPQPHYVGDEFIQADALEYAAKHGREFDAIHASPPCQFASEATPTSRRAQHRNYIPEVRKILAFLGKPWSIENVEGARSWLINPIMLCGTMFPKLMVWRHRYFEVFPKFALSPAMCNHRWGEWITLGDHRIMLPVLSVGGGDSKRSLAAGKRKTLRARTRVGDLRLAMDIDWMTQSELYQAIPPAYTEFIGRILINSL